MRCFFYAAAIATMLPTLAMAQDAMGYTRSPPAPFAASQMPESLNSLPAHAATGTATAEFPSRAFSSFSHASPARVTRTVPRSTVG